MSRPGEQKLKHLFRPGSLGRFATKNMVEYGSLLRFQPQRPRRFHTPRELARVRVIASSGCDIHEGYRMGVRS